MSIVLVGGHERMARRYDEIAGQEGHKLKIFNQMPTCFEKRIGSPDAIVIFTNEVSHKMVKIAQREGKRLSIPVFKSHTSSGSSLKRMMLRL